VDDKIEIDGIVFELRPDSELQYSEAREQMDRGYRVGSERLEGWGNHADTPDMRVRAGDILRFKHTFRRRLYCMVRTGRAWAVYHGVKRCDGVPLAYFTQCGFTDTEAEIARELFIKQTSDGKVVYRKWRKNILRRNGLLGLAR